MVGRVIRVGNKFYREIERLRNDYQFKFNKRITQEAMADLFVDLLRSKRRKKNDVFMEI